MGMVEEKKRKTMTTSGTNMVVFKAMKSTKRLLRLIFCLYTIHIHMEKKVHLIRIES